MMCDFLSKVGPLSGSLATLVRLPGRLLMISRSLSRDLGQISDSYQVVGGSSELEDPTHQLHEKSGHQCFLAEALTTHGIALARLGKTERAQFTIQRAIEVAHQAGSL